MYLNQINNPVLSASTGADTFASDLPKTQSFALRPSRVRNTAEAIAATVEIGTFTVSSVLKNLAKGLVGAGVGLGVGVASVAFIEMNEANLNTVEAIAEYASPAAAVFGLVGLTAACAEGVVAAFKQYVSPVEAMRAESLEETVEKLAGVETDLEVETDVETDYETAEEQEPESLLTFKKTN